MRRGMIALLLAIGAILGVGVAAPAHASPEVGQDMVNVYFKSKKWNLDKAAKQALRATVPELQDATSIRIDGFVQAAEPGTGTKRYLSRDRARSVEKFLAREFKKRKWKISISIRGMGRPEQNYWSPFARRAEVIVTGVK